MIVKTVRITLEAEVAEVGAGKGLIIAKLKEHLSELFNTWEIKQNEDLTKDCKEVWDLQWLELGHAKPNK